MADPRSPIANSGSSRHYNAPSDTLEDHLESGIGDQLPEFNLDLDDDELASNITKAIDQGIILRNEVKPIMDLNEDYYLGNQISEDVNFGSRKVRVIENRQFISGETLIPVVTTQPPEPIIFTGPDEADAGRSLEKVLVGKYEDDETDIVMNVAVRHWMNYRIGVLKLVLDIDSGEWETIWVRPQRLVIAPDGVTEREVSYIAELVEEPLSDMIEKFDDKEDDIIDYLTGQNNGTPPALNTPVRYWEFWTNEIVAWKLGANMLLDASENPLFDFDNLENNFIRRPEKPYFFLNRLFSFGKHAYDDTTMVEQDKTIQDGINKTHWAIGADIADRGTVVGSGDGISKEELKKYKGEEGEKLFVDAGKPKDVIDRLPPKQVNATALLYQQRLADRSDDIWGTHSVSRGESGGEQTVGGKVLLKEHDERRTAPISRILHSVARRLYTMQIQCIKLYWKNKKEIPYVDPQGVQEIIEFSKENVPTSAKLRVKSGSMLPQDKLQQRNEAMELAKTTDRIDNETLFERLGWDKPKEAAKRVYMAKMVETGALPPDVLFPGIGQEIQEALAQAQQANQSVTADATATGAPPAPNQMTPELAAAAMANAPVPPAQPPMAPPAAPPAGPNP